MINGLWGKKIGMTQVFVDNHQVVPVTVIDVADWLVTNIKTATRDGYDAVQIGCLRKEYVGKEFSTEWLRSLSNYFSIVKEVPVTEAVIMEIGAQVDIASLITKGDAVDVVGWSIGRGFQGGVKRHGFTGGLASHGSKLGRRPGSLGNMRSRGRVIKGQRMAGHMGTDRCVMRNLEIVMVKPDARIVLVKGSIPGKSGSLVFVKKCR